jgi:autotransporter-associated beta strand protein
LVTFNDTGSGTVFLSNNVGPTSLVISNNTKTYTFTGSGTITGPTDLQKLGSGTTILSLTNCSYQGTTIISNGTLQLGNSTVLPQSTILNIGSSGTLELAGNNLNAGELTGSGILDDNVGNPAVLTIGTSLGGTWNGSIQDQGHNGIALIKNGTGTWIIGGANKLDNGASFTTTNQFNAGTTIITNGGSFSVAVLQTMIAFGGSASVIVAGGSLSTSNDILAVGYSAGANGTLTVNSGSVYHGGGPNGGFGGANELIVGGSGATGTLTVNGGQVLNSQALWLGQGTGASGTLQLNGGLVQASQVTANGTPAASVANFNGGTLQANTNSGDFINSSTTVNIQTGGLILDDGGFTVTVQNGLAPDATLTGGGLVKKGAGTVYLDGGNIYTGTTLVTNGLLAGGGSINGPVVVGPAGNLGAGDPSGIGTLTIFNNVTFQGGATMRINATGGGLSQDQIVINGGNVTYGGILTVTNITSDSTALTTSDTFQLFNVSGTKTGNFSGIAGSPGSGLAYSFNPANGVLSIITQTIAPNPTNIVFSVSGHTLSLSWPADHLGWILQAQTNSLGSGLSPVAGNWFDIPGSSSTTSAAIPIDPTKPTVYYRLRHP